MYKKKNRNKENYKNPHSKQTHNTHIYGIFMCGSIYIYVYIYIYVCIRHTCTHHTAEKYII